MDRKVGRATYDAQYGRAVADIWDVAKGFGIAGEKGVANAHGRRGNASTSIDNGGANDVCIDSVASLEHGDVRLAIEHIFVDGFDVLLVRIVPDFAFRVEVSRGSKINEVTGAADVDQLTLRSAVLFFQTSDYRSDWIFGKRVAGIHDDIMLFADVLDLLRVAEVTDNDVVHLEGGFELSLWLRAAEVSGYRPVWVGLLDSPDIRG
jgi:hypothetical protein